MRPFQRLALAKRLDKLAPGRDWQLPRQQMSRDQSAFLWAFNITLQLLPDPIERYAYTLTADGSAMVAEFFKITAGAANADHILPTDTPEAAQAKYRDWIG